LKKFGIYLILIAIVSAVAIYLLNSFGGGIDWKETFNFFTHDWWGVIGLISLLVSWLADSSVIYLLVNKGSDKHFSFFKSFKTSIIGAFFGMLTPSYSGGQPMQLVYMSRHGISLGVSTSVMVFRFVVEQGALETIAIFGLLRAMRLMTRVPAAASLAFLGFALSTGMIFFLITLSLSKRVYDKIFGIFKWFIALFKFSKKLRPKVEMLLDRVDTEIGKYAQSTKILSKDPLLLILTFFLGVLSNLANFFLVYVAVAATGLFQNTLKTLLNVISVQSLATMIIYFSPTPGSSGVAEGGFYLFFSSMVPREYLGTVTFEWRILSYFIPLLIGFILVTSISFHGVKLRNDDKTEVYNNNDKKPG